MKLSIDTRYSLPDSSAPLSAPVTRRSSSATQSLETDTRASIFVSAKSQILEEIARQRTTISGAPREPQTARPSSSRKGKVQMLETLSVQDARRMSGIQSPNVGAAAKKLFKANSEIRLLNKTMNEMTKASKVMEQKLRNKIADVEKAKAHVEMRNEAMQSNIVPLQETCACVFQELDVVRDEKRQLEEALRLEKIHVEELKELSQNVELKAQYQRAMEKIKETELEQKIKEEQLLQQMRQTHDSHMAALKAKESAEKKIDILAHVCDLFDDYHAKGFMAVAAVYQQVGGNGFRDMWPELGRMMNSEKWQGLKRQHGSKSMLQDYTNDKTSKNTTTNAYVKGEEMKWLTEWQNTKMSLHRSKMKMKRAASKIGRQARRTALLRNAVMKPGMPGAKSNALIGEQKQDLPSLANMLSQRQLRKGQRRNKAPGPVPPVTPQPPKPRTTAANAISPQHRNLSSNGCN